MLSQFAAPGFILKIQWVVTPLLITLLKINKANGHDDIPPYFLGIAVNTLALPLSSILNQFLLLGIFPDKLKLLRLYPCVKMGVAISSVTINQFYF